QDLAALDIAAIRRFAVIGEQRLVTALEVRLGDELDVNLLTRPPDIGRLDAERAGRQFVGAEHAHAAGRVDNPDGAAGRDQRDAVRAAGVDQRQPALHLEDAGAAALAGTAGGAGRRRGTAAFAGDERDLEIV